MTTAQIATGINRREHASPASAASEIVLLSEILNTVPPSDPLHSKILDLFAEESDGLADDTWNQRYEQVFAEARRRIV